MKRIFLSIVFACCVLFVGAQTPVKGDMNGDGEITIEDVNGVAEILSGITAKETIKTGDPYEVDNSLLVGIWTSSQGSISFVDKAKCFVGTQYTYLFRRQQGTLMLLDGLARVKKVYHVLMASSDYLLLNELGTSVLQHYYKGPQMSGVSLSQTELKSGVGETYQLTANVTPSDAAITELQWTSSDEEVATVSQTGLVTITGVGTCTITASAQDGTGLSATCSVTAKSLTLDKMALSLDMNANYTLTATLLPTTTESFKWKSDDNSVATVSSNGEVTAVNYGTATITCSTEDGALKATCIVKVRKPLDANGHAYVDLGLPSGTLWATCNVGASEPKEYGDYFSWGESEAKLSFSYTRYKWYANGTLQLTKYCNSSEQGIVDNKTVLEEEDDAAHVNWGGDWRTPTVEQMKELSEECTWKKNGSSAVTLTGPNGNSIDLPLAGFRDSRECFMEGYYWLRSLASDPVCALLYYIQANIYDDSVYRDSRYNYRYFGMSIRPVLSYSE